MKICNRPYYLVLFLTAFFGCGQAHYPAISVDPVSSMKIEAERGRISVGAPLQMSVTVTFGSGEEIEGLTTTYEDPHTGVVAPIRWETSDGAVAFVDGSAHLIPLSFGHVTVNATLLGHVMSKSISVIGSLTPSTTVPPDGDSGEGGAAPSGEPEESPSPTLSPCQGNAAAVTSFLPGTGAGFGSSSFPDIVLGPPKGAGDIRGSTDVLSLGREGEIVLDLGDCILVDGTGIDLIVFENTFLISGDPENPYAELGAVGVSEDGAAFVEFPCSEGGFPYTGCAGWNPVYSSPSNGISSFDTANAGGDQFDLADIGVASARYVRIRDMGTVGFGTSVGFDLDAISVVNGVEGE